tara:strand:- start:123 stop:1037 length:915 start_codon:yes stop_codon:yes gene_type:complete
MKNVIVALILGLSLSVNASHLHGGMMSVSQTSQDSTSIGVSLLFDSQGIPNPNSISIQRWEMNSQGSYVLGGYITAILSNSISHQGVNLTTYISDYQNLDSNKYRFIYENCCWGNINNSTNSFSSSIVISADYWHIPNNSTPYMEMPLWVNMAKDSVNIMKPIWGVSNCFFHNSDITDSVDISLSDLYSGYVNGVFVSQQSTASNMYVGNDSITFVSSTLGSVGNGFEINDYRNGQKIGTQRIQWTFRVLSSTIGVEELELERDVVGIWDWSGRYMGADINSLKNGKLYVVRYNDGSYSKIIKQ